MPPFTLFPDPGPPLVSPIMELDIEVPCVRRAELYRDLLEETYLTFNTYAARRPRVRAALLAPNIYSALATILENFVAPGIAADVNAPAYAAYFWDNPRNAQTTYNRYADLC